MLTARAHARDRTFAEKKANRTKQQEHEQKTRMKERANKEVTTKTKDTAYNNNE